MIRKIAYIIRDWKGRALVAEVMSVDASWASQAETKALLLAVTKCKEIVTGTHKFLYADGDAHSLEPVR